MLRYTRISDPEVYELTQKELRRQEKNIEMIASESTVPPEIMELQGNVFTNKTLEGYPGARYQAGSRVAGLIAKVAAEEGYIPESDIARLIAFRDNPSDESWIGK